MHVAKCRELWKSTCCMPPDTTSCSCTGVPTEPTAAAAWVGQRACGVQLFTRCGWCFAGAGSEAGTFAKALALASEDLERHPARAAAVAEHLLQAL